MFCSGRGKLVKEIIEYGKLCGVKNFTPGYSGNISARFKEGMLITASGSSNGYLKPNQIVYTDFDGNEHREYMKSGRWEKSIKAPVPPVASMIRVEASRNANKIDDKEIVLEMDFLLEKWLILWTKEIVSFVLSTKEFLKKY